MILSDSDWEATSSTRATIGDGWRLFLTGKNPLPCEIWNISYPEKKRMHRRESMSYGMAVKYFFISE